jgi:hypothetical protein
VGRWVSGDVVVKVTGEGERVVVVVVGAVRSSRNAIKVKGKRPLIVWV